MTRKMGNYSCEGRKEKKKVEENREKEVMEAAIQAGHLLLENGAEISRVEETMERIFRYYGGGVRQYLCAVKWNFCNSREQ